MAKKLTGKVALITGGSRGIGAAAARALADEGAHVAFSYAVSLDKAEALVRELQAKGVRAAAFKADQADVKQAAGLVDSVVKRFGKLDILVNNAAILVLGVVGDPSNDLQALSRQFAINVVGAAATVHAAAAVMGQGGRIISVGSANGARVAFPSIADYAATKSALIGYTKGWCRDLAAKGITVNLVQPGPIDTEMNPANGELAAAIKANTALGRYGTAAEVAAAIVFLASPEASYITGASLDVDGGQNA